MLVVMSRPWWTSHTCSGSFCEKADDNRLDAASDSIVLCGRGVLAGARRPVSQVNCPLEKNPEEREAGKDRNKIAPASTAKELFPNYLKPHSFSATFFSPLPPPHKTF